MGRKSALEKVKESNVYSVPVTEQDVKDREILRKWHKYTGLGLNPSGIISRLSLELNLPPDRIHLVAKKANLIIESKKFQSEVKEEVLKDKVPILKEIVGTSLTAVQEYLVELGTNKERLHSLSVSEMKGLADVAKSLNELLRLELGQSTQNVQVVQYSFNEAKVMLEDLRKIDPVFEYPALDHDEPKEANPPRK